MEVYIQGGEKLIPLQGDDVTADSIENALGYTPADAETVEDISNTDDTAFYIVDKNQNIIAKIDAEGVKAAVMTVNGKDVESGLVTDEDRASWGGSDLDDVISKDDDSTLYIVDKDNNVLAKIDSEGIKAIEVKVGEDQKSVTEHIEDGGIHATASEKAHWNDKSFDSLTDSPISSADDEVLYVVDKDQKIIAKIDKDGIHVAEVYIGNETDGELTAENLMKKILADWVGAAPAALDTIIELANAIQSNKSVLDALDQAITNKANASDLDAHIGDNSHITADEREAWNKKLDGSTFEEHKADNTVHLGDELKKDDDTTLYIVDKNNNIIARFDGTGLDVAVLKLGGIVTKHITQVSDNVIVLDDNTTIEFGASATQVALLDKLSQWYDGEHFKLESFTMSPTKTIYEKGSTANLTFSWQFSGMPTAVFLNDVSQTASETGSASESITSYKRFTLKAYGAGGAEVEQSISVYFYNKYYYGCAADTTITGDFIKSLGNSGWELTSGFSVSPSNQYVYYAYPSRLGLSEMWVNGFRGSFENPVEVSVTNASGYAETYYVYKSINALSGTITVEAK